MSHSKTITTAVIGVLLVHVPEFARAYPGFARKYQTSCVTCHDAFPRLNSVGQGFRLNGYRFLDDEAYVREEPISLGAPAYKRVWPEAIWPSDLPLHVPLGVSVPLTVRRTSSVSTEEGADWDFNFPNNVTLLGGGTIGEDMAFWASVEFEDGDARFHRVFFEWNDLLSGDFLGLFSEEGVLPENLLNLKLGQIDPGVVPFSIHRQLTLSSYLTNTYTVGGSDFALESPGLTAIELFGLPTSRLGYWMGVTTGTSGEDDNPAKDFYGRIAYKIGGVAFDGTLPGGEESDESDELPAPTLSDETSLILGVSGYVGEPRARMGALRFDEDIFRVGGDFQLTVEKLILRGHYVLGEDENAFNDPAFTDTLSQAFFVEASYAVFPWLYPAARYEALHIEERGDDRIQRAVFAVTALLRANVRTSVEYRAYINGDRGADDSPDALLLNLWMAF